MIDPLSMVGWIVAALTLGLWWGERGRRRSAERYLVSGTPDTSSRKAVSRLPSQETEDRWRAESDEAQKEAVDRGVAEMMADARAKGITVDPMQLRKDVETMLSGQDVME